MDNELWYKKSFIETDHPIPVINNNSNSNNTNKTN